MMIMTRKLANAKVSDRQQCVYEGHYSEEIYSKLTMCDCYPIILLMVNSKCAIVSRGASASGVNLRNGTVKGKADDLYRGSMQSEDHRRTALQYPLVHWTLCPCQQYGAFSMKALANGTVF